MKISQRLQQINQMIVNDYQHIWDCCCDHGLLGAALLERKAAQQIHFVDVVPNLMQQLEHKLQRFYPQTAEQHNQHGWQVHCTDVGQLNLADKHARQLVIIAGVGGDLTIALMQQIIARHPQHQLEFILCPVHHIYKVRMAMKQLGLGLISEQLVQENRRFYEILHLSTMSEQPISAVGSVMWGTNPELEANYLASILKHYQRIADGLNNASSSATEKAFIKHIIADYQSLIPYCKTA
ncbi:tRNA (adenine(22)-N(1))-methyltransferase [Shewanella halifaxensis]|uniref:tRNA (adenine(22)-N(1))-methyltransferase n=1 Tax=Shewanella halifaxensis TaxID=271098 RepID=UPI000D58D111|nr:tRNA (adenine(22)-N(1))-methyltransferase TrmK [Shewanella halifaxensis]